MPLIQIIDGEDYDVYIFGHDVRFFLDGKNLERAENVRNTLIDFGIYDGIFALDPFQNKLYDFKGSYDLNNGMNFTPYDPDDFIRVLGEKAKISEDPEFFLRNIFAQYGGIYSEVIDGVREWYIYWVEIKEISLFNLETGTFGDPFEEKFPTLHYLKNEFGNFYYVPSEVTKNIQNPIEFYKDIGVDILIEFEFFGRVFFYYKGLVSPWVYYTGYLHNGWHGVGLRAGSVDYHNLIRFRNTSEIDLRKADYLSENELLEREEVKVLVSKFSDKSYEILGLGNLLDQMGAN